MVAQYKLEKASGYSRIAVANECPSNTLPRTDKIYPFTFGFSACSPTACNASSIGKPAANKVANCLVNKANSLLDNPLGPNQFDQNGAEVAFSRCVGLIVRGINALSLSICLACFSVSASMTPFCSRPP